MLGRLLSPWHSVFFSVGLKKTVLLPRVYHFCRLPADLSCDVSNSTTSDVATWHYASEIRRLQFR